MNVILLSGGSGKRLWPLSSGHRPKQFLQIFKRADGSRESMLQRVYRQIKAADPDAAVTIAASRSQVSMIRDQLGEDVGVCVEPCRRDTFPAIALATAYLHDVRGVGGDEAVAVCPADAYVDGDYFQAVKRLWGLARAGTANLMLLGIQPTDPSEKYGYIIPMDAAQVSKVRTFREKPDAETARQYIQEGGLWNGGVFAYKISYVLERAEELLGCSKYATLLSGYNALESISFDYAVAERESNIAVTRFGGRWKDLGSWDALTEMMEEPTVGTVRLSESCENVHVVNELGIPILAMGIRDVVISASPEGILISDKRESGRIKPFVEEITARGGTL